jgi:hypothetical protein
MTIRIIGRLWPLVAFFLVPAFAAPCEQLAAVA